MRWSVSRQTCLLLISQAHGQLVMTNAEDVGRAHGPVVLARLYAAWSRLASLVRSADWNMRSRSHTGARVPAQHAATSYRSAPYQIFELELVSLQSFACLRPIQP